MAEIKLWGVRICISFSFLVFLALLFLMKSGGTIFAFFTVCLIHELGHAAALCIAGGSLSQLTFCGMGIKMIPCRNKLLSFRNELFVLLAGPAVNISVFLILNTADRGNYFALLNLCAAVFNLLPYKMLDGGAVLQLLSDCSSCGKTFSAAAGLLRIALLLCAVYAVFYWGMVCFPLLCTAVFYFFADI